MIWDTSIAIRVVAATPASRAALIAQLAPYFRIANGDGADAAVADVSDVESDAARELFAASPSVVVVDDVRGAEARTALRAGARGIVARDTPAEEIAAAVRAAAIGYAVMPPELFALIALPEERTTAAAAISERERDVLRLLARGLSNKAIAAHLRISEHTAKFHVSSILAKLGAASRTEAVTIGVRVGLVMI